ncbi:unnamed protein product [Arctia plantaginis]|uniref:Uncharacterized protein n=1 Tax=Arctia plantaginis TaxID=874455 RepID=A0A8S1ALV0_ARCPL|nr:unnamed protein product [Arctia plantaginis]
MILVFVVIFALIVNIETDKNLNEDYIDNGGEVISSENINFKMTKSGTNTISDSRSSSASTMSNSFFDDSSSSCDDSDCSSYSD